MTLDDALLMIYSALDDKGELPETIAHHPSSLFLDACDMIRKSSKAERKAAQDRLERLIQEAVDSAD